MTIKIKNIERLNGLKPSISTSYYPISTSVDLFIDSQFRSILGKVIPSAELYNHRALPGGRDSGKPELYQLHIPQLDRSSLMAPRDLELMVSNGYHYFKRSFTMSTFYVFSFDQTIIVTCKPTYFSVYRTGPSVTSYTRVSVEA